MKRLKNKLLSMDPNTTTYTEMYTGEMMVVEPEMGGLKPYPDYSPVYYNDDIGFEITRTHKLAQDKPTVRIIIPAEKLGINEYNSAVADFCLREFAPYIDELNTELYNGNRPDNENGKYYLCKLGGEILARNTAYFAVCMQKDYRNGSGSTVYLLGSGLAKPPQMCLCIRMQVQLPYKKIRKTIQMLCKDLPNAVDMFINEFDINKLDEVLALFQKQEAIRSWLKTSNYCAFIANGSILPRLKGTDLPMSDALPFQSTPNDEIEICGIKGMGIKRGVTVITGGGYSGKSTLLNAISAGIYNHIAGDGRELCITDDTAMTISAEDGRSVKHTNISPFIKWLPQGDTVCFSSDHASGSTSQSANIMEAVDYGTKLLLIDEDKSATNFMIRDRVMKELIAKEPITPFTDRVNELYRKLGVSTILVIGGSSEYLAIADKIYIMEEFQIQDTTENSKAICNKHSIEISPPSPALWKQNRTLSAEGFTSYPGTSGKEKLAVYDLGFIMIGDEKIDTRGLHNIVTARQLFALGFMLRYLEASNKDEQIDIYKKVDELYDRINTEGLDFVYSGYFTTCERFLDLPRKQELLAVINRMRNIKFI